VVLKHNAEHTKKKHNPSFHSKYYIIKMPSITLLSLSKPISFNNFNTTTFLLNSWASLFEVVYPRLYGMSWRHFTVSMNPEFLAKFTFGGNVAIVVLIKWFYGESTLCTRPRLHFKLNAIPVHATWQLNSPSPLTLKIKKHRCQIARFTGGPCTFLCLRMAPSGRNISSA